MGATAMRMPAQRACHCKTRQVAGAQAPASRAANAGVISNQALQRSLFARGVQAKAALSEPGDALEREADRVADAVLRMPDPTAGRIEHRSDLPVQRKCAACAAAPKLGKAKCAACEAEERGVQRKPAAPTASGADTSPLGAAPRAAEVLNAPDAGAPLAAELRAFFEPRFQRDFADVRVHTGAEAAESAYALDALAYTSGNHIVFGEEQYAPDTSGGRRLLAHELAHVAQQRAGARGVQRFVDCTPARLSLRECPPRERGEVARSRTTPMAALEVGWPERGMLVANFAVGSSQLKPNLAGLIYWQEFMQQIERQTHLRWEILGLSDCEGDRASNERLRAARAKAVYDSLPAGARRHITLHEGAPIHDCMTGNDTEADRTMNRAVLVRRAEVGTVLDIEPEAPIEVEPPKFACGPDVTAQIEGALSNLRSAFGGWPNDKREEACDALDSIDYGACAWDIVQLHNNAWIHEQYRPQCATEKGQPPCGSSVQVGDACYYAGSANYVVFGAMCRLCFDHFVDRRDLSGAYRFSRSSMRALVNLYKGTGPAGLGTPSANFAESLQWSEAGFDRWPGGGKPPPGDRQNCRPVCPLPYAGPPFTVHWYPPLPLEVCTKGQR